MEAKIYSCQRTRNISPVLVAIFLFFAANAQAESTGTALVKQAPEIDGRVEGSIHQLEPKTVHLKGNSVVTGDLLVPGTPEVSVSGNASYLGTLEGAGPAQSSQSSNSAQSGDSTKSDKSNKSGKSGKSGKSVKSDKSNKSGKSDKSGKSGKSGKSDKSDKSGKSGKSKKYEVILSGHASLGYVIRRTEAVLLPEVSAPPQSTNHRSVRIRHATDSAGNFSTLRDLKLYKNVGLFPVPSGTYGEFEAASGSGFLLGVAGSTEPTVYSFEKLDLSHDAEIRLAGPVIVTLAEGLEVDGIMGESADPGLLTLNIYSGDLKVEGHGEVFGCVTAPQGQVRIKGELTGGVASDRLKVYSGGVLRLLSLIGENVPPVAIDSSVALLEDSAAAVPLIAADPDGDLLTYAITTLPEHGSLTGSAPNLNYTPDSDFAGTDSLVFQVWDGQEFSNFATVSLIIDPVNDQPVADSKSYGFDEDTNQAIELSGTDLEGDSLVFTIEIAPTQGTLSGGGFALTYTPDQNYFGPDSFQYSVSDGALISAPAEVSLTIVSVNDAPVAENLSLGVSEGAQLPVELLASDVENDPIVFQIVSGPSSGTVSGVLPNLVYTPAANFQGGDAITFTASDGALTSASATIAIAVTNLNDAPVALTQTVSLLEDATAAIELGGVDPDGDALTVLIVSPPSFGSLTGSAPDVIYVPNENYFGADAFSFVVNDGELDSAVAAVSISVSSVNDVPTIEANPLVVAEDMAGTVLLTLTDIESDPLTVEVVTGPTNGTVSGDPRVPLYTPNPDYFGSDGIEVRVTDGAAVSDPITVSISVTPVNDAPVVAPATIAVTEDVPEIFALTVFDAEGDPVTYQIVIPPLKGTLVVDGAGQFTFTPYPNEYGSDSFVVIATDAESDSDPVTIGLEIAAVNDAPLAANDAVTTDRGVSIDLVLMGSDIDGDDLIFTIVSSPLQGTLSGALPNLTYTPIAGYAGNDSFTFRASDGVANSNVATVSIVVNATNQAPTAAVTTVSTDEDTAAVVTLLGEDLDGDVLTYQILASPVHGILTGIAPNFVYTPASNYAGPDSFTFEVNDGVLTSNVAMVLISIAPVNDAPSAVSQTLVVLEDNTLAVTLDGSDPEGTAVVFAVSLPPQFGSLSGTLPDLVYTPGANFNGTDRFEFEVSDGELTGTGVIEISVAAVNDTPVAQDQAVVTNEDLDIVILVVGSDVDGDSLSYVLVDLPTGGTVTGTGPDFTYVPSPNFNGADGFTFRVSDGVLESGLAAVSITVTPVNDVPVAEPQSLITLEDTALNLLLGANDHDGDALTYQIESGPTNGTLSGTAPALVYTPSSHFGGSDAFTFWVNDGILDSAPVTVSLTVQSVNDAPTVISASVTLDEDVPTSIVVDAFDVEGDALALTVLVAPLHGTLAGDAFAPIYTPNANYYGADEFVVQVSDGQLLSNEATVSLTIDPINDAPVVTESATDVVEDTPTAVSWDLFDVEGDTLTVTVVVPPTHGTLSGDPLNPVYSPNEDYAGPDQFVITANDGQAISTETTISLTVTPVNDAPVVIATTHDIPEDEATPFALTATDVDGDPLTYTITVEPAQGTLTVAPDGTFTYTPGADFNGEDSFTVVANDGQDDSAPTVITLNVTPVNDAPIAQNGSITTDRNVVAPITLLASDVEGDALTYTITSSPANGVLSGIAPNLTYTPATDFAGNGSFTFVANDGALDSNASIVSIIVAATNRAPVATDEVYTLDEDATADVTLDATDADADPLTFTIVTPPQHGVLSGTAPNLVYIPEENYFGSDAFTFQANDGFVTSNLATIDLAISSVNDVPSVPDQALQTPHHTPLAVVFPDFDQDGDVLAYTLIGPPAEATVTATANGFLYSPRYGFWGTDVFAVTATDGIDTSAPITITIEVLEPIGGVVPTVALAPVAPAPQPFVAFSLRATALDADGSVAQVEFYQDGSLIASVDRSEPGDGSSYLHVVQAGLPPGDYVFTARVVDDQGFTSDSDAVSLTVTYDPSARVFTTSADFEAGILTSILSEDDQLTTSFSLESYDFVWAVNSTQNRVIRLDTETARVLSSHRTGPDGEAGFPTSIAIDSKGNAWVANRQTGRVVKFGLGRDNGFWVDRNSDGLPQTSTGLGDVKSWPVGGDPEDELVLMSIETGLVGLEHIALDADDNLWVGPYSGDWNLYDGETGGVLRTEPNAGYGGRGGFINEDGVQVSTGPQFMSWNTDSALLAGVDPIFANNVRANAWGVTRDFDGNYWVTKDGNDTVQKFDPEGSLLGEFVHGSSWAQGITTGLDGDIWVAHSHCGYTVGRLRPDGTYVGSVRVANHGPTQVATDRKGRIWVINTNGIVERINPLGGEIGEDGVTPIGEVDLSSPNLGGVLWTFGTFVGNSSDIFLQDGSWVFEYDSGIPNAEWGAVQWNALLCDDASVTVRVATSDDGLSFGAEQIVSLESPIPSTAGQYIRGRVDLIPSTTGKSPLVYDLTVGTTSYQASPAVRFWEVDAGNDLVANWPDVVQLDGAFCHSGHVFPVDPDYAWSLVSFTPLVAGAGIAPDGGEIVFGDDTDPNSTFTVNGVGTYVLRLTATLDGETTFDDVRAHVTPFNRNPFVSAGDHLFLRSASDTAVLRGTARDDGLPSNGTLSVSWSQRHGPGTVTFADTTVAGTTATFSAPGVYLLDLTGTDGELTHDSHVTIWVESDCTLPPVEGLISWWQGNGDGADHISGNQAFPENGAGFAEGNVGPSFDFDGVNDRLLVFGNPSLDVGEQKGIGLEFWVRPTSSRTATLLQYGRGVSLLGLTVEQVGTSLRTTFRKDDGSAPEISLSSAFTIGQWTHVGISYERETGAASISINGAHRHTQNVGAAVLETSYDVRLGGNWSNNGYFEGQLDEIAIYCRPLNTAEYWQIFDAGQAGKRPPNANLPPSVSAGAVGNYVLLGDDRVLTLQGIVTDDSLPADITVQTTWSVVSQPMGASVTFADEHVVVTDATFSAPGLYTLKLEADDAASCVSDFVEVRVENDSAFDLRDGLVAWWPGNGTPREVVSGRLEAVLNPEYIEGRVGDAFLFDAQQRRIFVPATPGQTDVGNFAAGFSMETWIKQTSGAFRDVINWVEGTTSSVRFHSFYDNAGGNHLYLYIGADRWYVGRLSTDWQHMAMTYDKPTRRLKAYVNAVLRDEWIITESQDMALSAGTAGSMVVGGLPQNSGFGGAIDELAFFNRPLSAAELAAVVDAESSGKNPDLNNEPPLVDAGPDRAVPDAGGSVALQGSVSDDGNPANLLGTHWTQFFGPSAALFDDPLSEQPLVTFSDAGIYGFKLTATDGLIAVEDIVEVRVATGGASEILPGLVAWWPGNGTTREKITGRLESGQNVAYQTGFVADAFSFDTQTRRIFVPATIGQTDVGNFDGGFTIDFWLNQSGGAFRDVLNWTDSSTSVRFYSEYDNALGHHLFFYIGSDRWYLKRLTPGSWQHFALTYDKTGRELRIYVDGVQVGNWTLSEAQDLALAAGTTGGMVMGGRPQNSGFEGGLDELTIHSRPLIQSEILGLFEARTAGKNPDLDNAAPAVDAGADRAVHLLSESARLQGTVSDDGRAFAQPVTQWTQLFGPATSSIDAPDQLESDVSFSAPGIYGFELNANDGLVSKRDTVEIHVSSLDLVEAPSGIVAWWPGNHSTQERISGRFESGLDLDYRAGKVGESFSFDTQTRRVFVPATIGQTDVGSFVAGFSIEFWLNQSGGAFRDVFNWIDTSSSVRFYSQYDNAGGNDLYFYVGSDRWYIRRLDIGSWQHFALTYDKSTRVLSVYADGAQVATYPLSGSQDLALAVGTAGGMVLGGLPQNTGFEGGLDELSIYDRPLDSAEIESIFSSSSSGKVPEIGNSPPTLSAGLDQTALNGPVSLMLNGSVSDDGPLEELRVEWTQTDGNTAANIDSPTSAVSAAEFPANGFYSFNLTVSDEWYSRTDQMDVRIGLPSALELPSGLVDWWRANNSGTESIRGIDNAVLLNGAKFAPAQVGSGFTFDGIDDQVKIAASAGIDIGGSAAGFSIEMWINPDEVRYGPLVNWHNGSVDGVHFWTNSSGNQLTGYLIGPGGTVINASSAGIQAGVWQHVALVYDKSSGVAKLYKDGVVVASKLVGTGYRARTDYDLYLAHSPVNPQRFVGGLDEVSLYDRPLSDGEVAAIFAAGGSGKSETPVNASPSVNIQGSSPAVVGVPLSLSATATDDGLPAPPAVLTYLWTKQSGPGNVAVAAPTALETTVEFDAAGTYVLRLMADDSELTGYSEITVTVEEAPVGTPPSVSIFEPSGGSVLLADTVFEIAATVTDLEDTIATVEFFADATLLGTQTLPELGEPNVYFWSLTSGLPVGTYSLTVRATDSSGAVSVSPAISITVSDDPSVVNSTLFIDSPTEDSRLSAPTEVTGLVASGSLTSWNLEYRLRPAGDDTSGSLDPWIEFAAGTDPVGTAATGSSAAVPGVLGTFDPTLLINGIYEIRLNAISAGGIATAGPITVIVDGNMKIGAFSVAFEDLSVPTAGIPISITRTYDSRDRRVGDFGPGWHLAVGNVRVQKNRNLGTGWWQTPQQGNGIQFYDVLPIDDRIVTVAMPDGETHRFKAGAKVNVRPGDPDYRSFGIVVREGLYKFYALGDTTATLEPIDASGDLYEQFWLEGTSDQNLLAGEFGDFDFTPYNPTRFRLTTSDGTVMLLDETLGLLELRDLTGNTLVLDRDANNRIDGITTTQNLTPTPLVRSVTIARDTAGLVDYVEDLDGNQIDYLYDTEGRLSSMTDRELNTTQFFYENASFPTYLTRITDPRGVTALRSEYDADGRLIKQIDADGNETVFDRGIDTNGRFETITDRLGHATTYYYDDRGNVTTQIDPLGAQTSFTYYPDTDRERLRTDHYGNVTSLSYDVRGNVTHETIGADASEDPTAPATGYTTVTTYNSRSAPTTITDPDGRVQAFAYDPVTNNLLSHTIAGGSPEAATTTYAYKDDGSLDTITDAIGTVTGTTYDYAYSNATYQTATKRITTTVTDSGATTLRSTQSIFDSEENQLASIVTRTLSDASTEDIVTTYNYDAENRLVATILPDGRVTETRYTAFGAQAATAQWQSVTDYTIGDDSAARITSMTYDDRGNVTAMSYPDGTTTATGFDLENRQIWTQDQLGYRTYMIYDELGRVRFTIHPDDNDGVGAAAPIATDDARLTDNPRTETVYDLTGRVTDTYDELGNRYQFVYEDGCSCFQRRKESIQHLSTGNLTTSFQYDQAGNVTHVTDPRGNTTQTSYDDQGRPYLVTHPATDQHPATSTETTYDVLGRRVAISDQEDKLTRYRYDGLGRLVEVRQYLDQALAATDADFALAATHASLIATTYAYDEAGNQTTQTDALGRATAYVTDQLGRRVTRTLPDAAAETLTYDDWGNMATRTDFAGHTTSYRYDTLNRLTTKTADATHPSLAFAHAVARVEYDYDDRGSRTAARTYNTASAELYSETTPVDIRGRLDHKDTAAGRLDYGYLANNLLEDVVSSNADGVNIGYRYDDANRLEHVDDASTGVPAVTSSYTYNANGSMATMTTPNAVTHTYTYDTLNRLRTLNVTNATETIHTYDYALRASGHRSGFTETATRWSQPATRSYSYDELYRLTGETMLNNPYGNNGTVGYTLDKVGNRLNRVSNISAVSVRSDTYNNRDLLTTDTYDANGNTSIGTLGDFNLQGTDTYDFEDRLIVRTKPDISSINLSYDADGIRRQKTLLDSLGGLISTTTYLTDTNNHTGYAQVFEGRITDVTGTTVKTYTYGTDLIASHSTAASVLTTSYLVYDGGGTVRELTDATGAITDSYDYDAYGILIASTGTTDNAYLYRGEQFDEDIGLYYLRARFMNPESGRFWNMDVFDGRDSEPISLHKYLYASSNPIDGFDPSGYFTMFELQIVNAIDKTVRSISVPSGHYARRKGIKTLSCVAGISAAKRWTDHEFSAGYKPQGHHPIPKGLGGNPNQPLLFLPENTHRAFHFIFDVFLKNDKEFKALGFHNSSKASKWEAAFENNPALKKRALKFLEKAGKIVDKKCKLPKKLGLRHYIKKNKKRWLRE